MSAEELSYLKESNILDPVHDTLDQEVFNGTTPKKDFFEYHLDHVKEVFRQHGFNPHAFDFYLTGSLCTYQYSSNSDVDISIVCNVNEFSDEDRADLISIVVNSLDGEFFPRTKHQYQHFVQPLGVDIEDLFVLGLRGAWDFQKDEWVLKPSRKRAHDISKEEPDWIVAGIQVSDKINSLIDNHNYDEAIQTYDQVHKKRQVDQARYGDYSEGNIIYKFLDNNGTFDRLRNIGKKISRVSFFISHDDDILKTEYFDTFNDPRKPRTHLNANGYPCACGFARRGKRKVLNEFYEKQRQAIKQSSYEDKDLFLYKTSATVDEVVNLVLETDLKEDSKWSKRNPKIREDAIQIINQYTTEDNKKYLRSAVNLLKKGITNKNYVELKAKDKKLIDVAPGGHFYDFESFKEIFRDLWTNNYGRGFSSWDDYRDFITNAEIKIRKEVKKPEQSDTSVANWDEYWNANDIWNTSYERAFFDQLTTIANLLDDIQKESFSNFLLNNQSDYYTQSLIRTLTGLSARYNEKLFTDWIAENAKKSLNHVPGEFLNILSSRLILEENVPRDEIEELLSEDLQAPEKELQKYLDQKNIKNVLNTFRSLLVRLDSVSVLIDRYNIKFNLNEISSMRQAILALAKIEEDVAEREEYRELLEEWKANGEWDSPTIFTYEEKKKNPYKATPGTWTVAKVQTEQDAYWEGQLMRHCINDEEQPHIHRLREGIGSFYSVRDPNGIPWATVATDASGQVVGEAFGRHDHPMREHEVNILNKFFLKEFGKNHEWFSKDDDEKSGIWNELESPEGEDREPQEIESYIEDAIGIGYFPTPVNTLEQAQSVVDWFASLSRSGYRSTNDEIWEGYQSDIEDDGDGPYYYNYAPAEVSFNENNVFNLIQEGINKYNQINQKENSLADEQDDSEYSEEEAIKDGMAVGVCLIVLNITGYHGVYPGVNTTLTNILEKYVIKEILDRSNSPATIAFLKPILFQIRQEVENVEEFNSTSIEDMVEKTGTPGSYNFDQTFFISDEEAQSVNEEINPVAPEIGSTFEDGVYVPEETVDLKHLDTRPRFPIAVRDSRGELTSENYQYYLEEFEKNVNWSDINVYKMDGNLEGLRPNADGNNEYNQMINPSMNSLKPLLSEMSWDTQRRLLSNPELIRQYLLTKRNEAYNKERSVQSGSGKTSLPGQLSFEMPQEPTEEEVQNHYQQKQQSEILDDLVLDEESDLNNPKNVDKYERSL